MKALHIAVATLTAALMPSVVQATAIDPGAYYFLTTNQTGAQTQIDINHTSIWTFSPTVDFLFGGGIFEMKDGPHTTEPITLAVTSDGGFNQSVTLPNSSFGQQYVPVQFLFSTPFTISASHNWTITLSSGAPDQQSKAYFVKDNEGGFYLGGDTEKPLDLAPAGVPEPASWTLLAGGALLAGISRLRRRRRA